METESSIHPYWSRRPSTPVSFAHVCPTPLWSFPIQAPVQMSLKCCYYMSWPSHIYLLDHLISTFIYLNWINLLLWLWLSTNVYDLFPHLTFLNCLEISVCRFWWWMSVISVSLHNWMIPVISILFLKFQFCFLHNLSFHMCFFLPILSFKHLHHVILIRVKMEPHAKLGRKNPSLVTALHHSEESFVKLVMLLI